MLFKNVGIRSVCSEIPPNIVTSEEVEDRLSSVYKRLKLPEGRLELMSGINERRFWDKGTRPSDASALAGRRALNAANISSNDVDCLIHASVSRDFLEPATAAIVHQKLGLSPDCMIFDISNACLGVLSGIIQVASMIDTGIIECGLIVSGEVAEPLYNATIKSIVSDKTLTRKSIKAHFASLTIGSGSCAVVLTKNNEKTHKLIGGAHATDSEANKLCYEGPKQNTTGGPTMVTDSEALLHAGCDLAKHTWEKLKTELNWTNETPDHIFTHQVGVAHQRLLFEVTGLDINKDFPTVSRFGNTGSAALPTALACGIVEKDIKKGQKLALLGIGSGLSSIMLGIEY